jgi:DHA1 family bicyclomycin/chloramphenicol resistance-like MFS transporter
MTTTARTQPSYVKLALILGILAAFGPLSIDMYLPALPTIADEFNTTTAAIQQTLSAFFIGLAVGQLFYGPISDRAGRRAPLLFGCAMYTVVSLGIVFAPSVGWLMGLRFSAGVGQLGGCGDRALGRARSLRRTRVGAHVLVPGAGDGHCPDHGAADRRATARPLRLAFGLPGADRLLALLCFLMVWLWLEESLPHARRATNRPGQRGARLRRACWRMRRYMGFALAGGLASAAMFAYISGSPFVFIELNGVAPEQFGFFFGANALGLIAVVATESLAAGKLHEHAGAGRRAQRHGGRGAAAPESPRCSASAASR